MAYQITDACAMCGMCVYECPNVAISEADEMMEIDPEKCTECVGSNPSPMCAKVCPNEAAVPDPAHEESTDELLAKWKSLHPGETPKLFS